MSDSAELPKLECVLDPDGSHPVSMNVTLAQLDQLAAGKYLTCPGCGTPTVREVPVPQTNPYLCN